MKLPNLLLANVKILSEIPTCKSCVQVRLLKCSKFFGCFVYYIFFEIVVLYFASKYDCSI